MIPQELSDYDLAKELFKMQLTFKELCDRGLKLSIQQEDYLCSLMNENQFRNNKKLCVRGNSLK